MATLKNLILEWKRYSAFTEDEIPLRILNKEKEAIKRAVKIKVEQGKEEISAEDQQIIDEILNFVAVLD